MSTETRTERMREMKSQEPPEPNVYAPRVDIAESESNVYLVVDVPGVDENGVDVTLEKNVLTIRASAEAYGDEVSGYGLAYAEYEPGGFEFERAFTVSNEIERENIEASVRDGVLRITLPKAKQATAQRVQVKAG